MKGRGAQVISSVLPWAGTGVQAEADASYGSILGFVASIVTRALVTNTAYSGEIGERK